MAAIGDDPWVVSLQARLARFDGNMLKAREITRREVTMNRESN